MTRPEDETVAVLIERLAAIQASKRANRSHGLALVALREALAQLELAERFER